jgi:hypothetical protein
LLIDKEPIPLPTQLDDVNNINLFDLQSNNGLLEETLIINGMILLSCIVFLQKEKESLRDY